MLKRLYDILSVARWCAVGVFIGTSLYVVFDHIAHPDLYAMTSAPWYSAIIVNALLSAAVIALLLIARFFIKRRLKREKRG